MRAVRLRLTCLLALAAGVLVVGCGTGDDGPSSPRPGALAGGVVPSVPTPVPIGAGARLRPGPGPGPSPTDARHPCLTQPPPRAHDMVHLELFAAGRTVIVPAGIGVGGRRRSGAFVVGGRCFSALRTSEPTGVVELTPGTRATVGDLFAVWGRPLAPTRLLAFPGRVRAWVDGRRWTRDVRAIPLRPRAQIVLVVGPDVPVHATYAFPPHGVTRLRP